MKRLFLLLFVFVAFVFRTMAADADAYDFEVGGLRYCIRSNNTVGVTYKLSVNRIQIHPSTPSEYTGIIEIPSTVEYEGKTYTVTSILSDAFNGAKVTEVILPNTIDSIGNAAFSRNSLTQIVLPSNLRYIGKYAFDATKITKITIPKSVETIDFYAFRGSHISDLMFEEPRSVALNLEFGCFLDCDYLTYLRLPERTNYIRCQAFAACSNLKQVILPSSVIKLETDCFNDEGGALTDVFCLGTTPPLAENDWTESSGAKHSIFYKKGNLYVLESSMDAYIHGTSKCWYRFVPNVYATTKRKITYKIEDQIVGEFDYPSGAFIQDLMDAPTQECAEFSGWSGYPADNIMPDDDIVITGNYTFSHSLVKTPAHPATCISSGNNAYWTCSECSKIFSDSRAATETSIDAQTIDALGHDYKNATWTWSGHESATVTVACSHDSSHSLCETASESDISCDVTTQETCTAPGLRTYIARKTVDGVLYTDTTTEVIEAKGHNIQRIDAKEATIKEPGNIEHWACSECQILYNDENGTKEISLADVIIPALPEPYTMSIAPVSSASGTSAILSVCMTNKNAINGFQFDLVLPEGVTLQKTARGKYIFNIGERGDDHTFSSILREDGSIRVVCTSLENTVFTGNGGEVCQIPVDLAESLINGTYAVRLKNVSLSDEASTDIQVDDVETNIIVLNDYFEIGTASGSVGKVVTLPVAMKNKSADICGFQCDIVMPEGFSIAVNDKGKYLLSVTERGDDHSFSALDRGNNTVRVVCTSLTNSSFTGSEGDLFEISLITSKSVEAGEYEIKLTNVALSNTASLDIPVADVSGTVTLKRYNPGDVNDDGKISVADVTAAISFVLGSESPSFIREAADMDASNEVKVNDVTAIISLVLNNDITPANAPARMLAMQRTSTENTSKLYVEPFSIAPGEEKYIDLMLDNPDLECIGWQADVQLPAGLSFATNEKGKYVAKINEARADGYSISSNSRGENTVRFIGVSMENFSIEGKNGAIMSILVKAESDAAEGIYYGSVANGALSDVASNDVPVDNSEFVATIAGEETDYAEGYSLVIKPFKAVAGTAYTLTMNFNCATEDITDIEFDIVAPAILARTKSGRASKAPAFANEDRICAEDHSIELAADGHVTISAIVSDEYRMIAGTSGSFVDFYYTANAGIAEGIYQFEINNIKMTMDDGTVLDVAPYKADVYVGSSKAVSENGCVAFNGDYADAATYKLLTEAMPAEGITSVDLTGVTALPANTTIALANPNALILTSKDLGLNNDQNVVIGDECAKFVITDGYPFNAPKSFTAADASYSRAMSNKYGTIVLPYAAESSATVQYYVLSDATVSGAEGTLIFTPVSSVAANQPALFQYTDGGEAEMVSMSVEVAATPSELIDILDGTDLQGSWAMLGSFEQQDVASPTVEGMTAYYIKNDTFWQANKSISVKPFRSYFLNGTTMQKTSYRIISDATGIEDITDQLNADDAVSYDLGGRQVETSEKNQVIVTNGSKTIIR